MADGHDHSSNPPVSRRKRQSPLSVALSRLRDDPVLFVPFLLMGIVLTVVDLLHRRDPIPALKRTGLGADGINIQVEFAGYPTGIGRTLRPLESLIGLEPIYLGWGLALYVLPLVAVTVAGAVTMARAMDRPVRFEAVASLFGFVVTLDLLQRLLGSIAVLQEMGLWGFVPLAIYFALFVRLFLVPGLLVAGRPLRTALRESGRFADGRGWSLFALVLAIGLAAWLLSLLPVVGPVLSSALVAPVHAVAIAVGLERGGALRPPIGSFG